VIKNDKHDGYYAEYLHIDHFASFCRYGRAHL
jgi:hypothetical protein